MSKEFIKIGFIIIAVLFIVIFFFKKTASQTAPDVIKSALQQGAVLVDVRTAAEFSSGSAKGAINIPLNQIEQHLQKFKTQQPIIVFCRSGNRSAQAQKILDKHGIKNVINGGTWQNIDSLIQEKK